MGPNTPALQSGSSRLRPRGGLKRAQLQILAARHLRWPVSVAEMMMGSVHSTSLTT
jgi:hypothetical protein